MKRIFFLITLFFIFLIQTLIPVSAEGEPLKIVSMHYDDSSSVVYLTSKEPPLDTKALSDIKIVKLSNPNRIYFDIENAVLIGDKQQLVFDKSAIKEIKLAQFETNPDIVRVVITFEEDFDTSKVKLFTIDGNIIVQVKKPALNNDYFNTIYDENNILPIYSSIIANSQFVQKIAIPAASQVKVPANVMDDIQRAFENSTLPNTDGKTYDSTVSVDLSSDLKLRTKYFISQYIPKDNGLLVSGVGQITTAKMFCLKEPNRAVIDLPNTYLDKNIRNKEINLCPDGSCKDTAKIGQFEYNKARIVITSDKADKYMPVYSQDGQSLLVIDSDKLNHTTLASNISNINKAFVRKIDSRTNELILSFSSPVVHSILRTENSLNFFLFNVKSYNEMDIIKTLGNSYYKQFTLSLLPKIGVRAAMPINKDDIVKVEQSIDAKALKITIIRTQQEIKTERPVKKGATKNKVVLDAGHGGTDYGAIKEGINEKDITLDITQRVDSILRSKGYKTALTRKNDTYVSLEDRVNFSEDEAPEIFVSIHVNSAVSTSPSGIETHYYHDYSKDLANVVHKHLMKEIDTNNRGLIKSKFYVINHTTVPAILCEIGFISNDKERNELVSEKRKKATAKAIAEGIMEYLKGGK